MNEKALKRGTELLKEIQVITSAMTSLKEGEAKWEADNYYLYISRHKDASGVLANLIGANVGTAVLSAVFSVLLEEVKNREEEFAAL